MFLVDVLTASVALKQAQKLEFMLTIGKILLQY